MSLVRLPVKWKKVPVPARALAFRMTASSTSCRITAGAAPPIFACLPTKPSSTRPLISSSESALCHPEDSGSPQNTSTSFSVRFLTCRNVRP